MKQKKRRRTSNSSLPEKRYQGSSLVDSCSPKSELSISGSAKKVRFVIFTTSSAVRCGLFFVRNQLKVNGKYVAKIVSQHIVQGT